MKTIKQLKKLIGYSQTDDVFKDYITQLEAADVIKVMGDDIVDNKVGDDFYERFANVFGIQLDDELNPIAQGDQDESGIR
ncbi:MAG: hypothetical protein ACRDCA_12345 [Serratia sp. (in: enterobacteria)]|uniref:hypothetical protein n=1 Tax=Serratia sp. (in: enterobacteria) TaxID=616 RepID=UPI003F2EB368